MVLDRKKYPVDTEEQQVFYREIIIFPENSNNLSPFLMF